MSTWHNALPASGEGAALTEGSRPTVTITIIIAAAVFAGCPPRVRPWALPRLQTPSPFIFTPALQGR